MIIRLALPAVLALLLLAGCDRTPGETATAGFHPLTGYDPQRDASADLKAALGEAARTERKVLVFVGGQWCSWCRRLDALFDSDQELSAVRDRYYVALKINWSKENRNEEVLARFPKIPGYPHLFVLAADGRLLHSQDTAELEAGDGHDRQKVLEFLMRWSG
jgi:thiol:disulfide interchange protein